MRFSFVRCALFIAGISVCTITTGTSAHAERVISDFEASKLTFASLTAAPPAYHARRNTRAMSRYRHVANAGHASSAHNMIRLVSYPVKHNSKLRSTHRHHT